MLADLLDKTAQIQTNIPSKDADGAVLPNWTTRIPQVNCSLWPVSVRVQADYAALDQVAQYIMVTACDVRCTTGERVIIDGATLYVVGYQPFSNLAFSPEQVFETILGQRNQN